MNLDAIDKKFRKRYVIKKVFNGILCLLTAFSGFSAVLYSVFIFKSNLFDRLRYMTFNGTIFTSIISLIFAFVSCFEIIKDTELTSRNVYYMRLSSAVTEFVIFFVVLYGLTPFVPDKPDIITYPGFNMHFVVPILTLISFIFNDAPIGRLKPLEPFRGTYFITIYAFVMVILFGFKILPSSKAPYSFLDFENNSIFFSIGCLIGIYIVGYSISLLLYYLNRKMSWIWFKDITK